MPLKKPIHCAALTDTQIALLCNNYAIKGLQLTFKGITPLDCSILLSLYGQGAIMASAISRLILRSRFTTYGILRRCADHGIIEQFGKQKCYRLTDKGLSVYLKYLEGYEVMRLNLLKLEDERLRRLRL